MAREAFVVGAWCGHAMPGTVALRCYHAPAMAVLNTNNVGLFARISYNDGQNETWAFTEIDHSASLGVVSTGTRWRRPDDRLGAAFVANGLSPGHRAYLAAGGYGFIVGDGALSYGPEQIGELYYSFALPAYHAAISPDYPLIVDPAYNRARNGPVHVVAVRLHVAF